jgi:hypothetical protein
MIIKNFISFLKKRKDFFVQDTVYSNYYATVKSLGSTLNMDCHSKNDIYDNIVFKTLKNNGYKLIVIKSGYSVTANFKDADMYCINQRVLMSLKRNLLDHTILRLDDFIGNSIYNRLKSQLKSIDYFII